MVLMTIAVSLLGFAIAKGCRYFVKCQRNSLLEPPLDLLNSESEEPEKISEKNEEKKHHPKYNKAQARQRLKKGRM